MQYSDSISQIFCLTTSAYTSVGYCCKSQSYSSPK